MKIVIVDYGIGNVRSIYSAFKNQGIKPILSNDSEMIFNADGIVLPGVGAYSHAMKNLKKYNLIKIIKNYAKTEKPILGICLGMQLLLEESEEFGITKGLGLIKGRVVKMPVANTFQTKLPNINWSALKPNFLKWDKTILNNTSLNSEMYFIHSYVANLDNENEVLSVTDFHNVTFCSALKKGNIYGCQFHPEKSSQLGLKIIKNFIKICK
jgi:glutamine amidotransferase